VRVLIADDHPLFRDGLRALLAARGIEVVGQAEDGPTAVTLARRLRPEVVLMDLHMPGGGGLEATRRLVAEAPEVKVVVLTASEDDADLFEAIKAGAQGFLPKHLRAEQFFELLAGVAHGEPALTPALARKLLVEFSRPAGPSGRAGSDPDALTERELEVLQLLVQGVTSNRELADRLTVSENTVKYHLRNILLKLHARDRAQAVARALREGLVDTPPPDAPHG
jgi:DNA-binding NarL/FixJ family response regulator